MEGVCGRRSEVMKRGCEGLVRGVVRGVVKGWF